MSCKAIFQVGSLEAEPELEILTQARSQSERYRKRESWLLSSTRPPPLWAPPAIYVNQEILPPTLFFFLNQLALAWSGSSLGMMILITSYYCISKLCLFPFLSDYSNSHLRKQKKNSAHQIELNPKSAHCYLCKPSAVTSILRSHKESHLWTDSHLPTRGSERKTGPYFLSQLQDKGQRNHRMSYKLLSPKCSM